MAEECQVVLPQCCLSRKRLLSLEQRLARWMEDRTPIRRLNLAVSKEGQEFSLSLSEPPGHRVIERPECTVAYKVARCSGAMVFGTDETCIRSMHASLSAWIRLSGGATR